MSDDEKIVAGPRLICDLMLGKLCRWLRMAGFDVLFPEEMNDDGLAALCLKSGRHLLTRDKGLSERARPKVLTIKGVDLDQQLAEFVDAFPGTKGITRTSNCPMCNGHLMLVPRSSLDGEMRGRIPDRVMTYQNAFLLCDNCDKVYWKGTHWAMIEQRLRSHGLQIEDPFIGDTEK